MADTRLEQLSKTSRNPAEESEYKTLLSQAGLPYYQGGGASSTYDFQNFAANAQAQAEQQKAMAPYIQSLEASKPEISARFAQERKGLEGKSSALAKRYEDLLSEVTRVTGQQTAAAQTGASRELGRRGISLQSGLADQYIQQKVQPVAEWATSQQRQLGTERETNLMELANMIAGLSGQETSALRDITNTIGQTQMGGYQSALAAAQNIMALKNQIQQQEANRALQIRQIEAGMPTELDKQIKQLQYDQALLNYQQDKKKSTGTGTTADAWIKDMRSQYADFLMGAGAEGEQQAIQMGLVGPRMYK